MAGLWRFGAWRCDCIIMLTTPNHSTHSHAKLLSKLTSYCISGDLLEWIRVRSNRNDL